MDEIYLCMYGQARLRTVPFSPSNIILIHLLIVYNLIRH